MPDYRVYVIGRDGHIVDCEVISCDDDQAAVRSAARMLRRDTLELWRMEHQLAEFKPRWKWVRWNPFRRRRRTENAHPWRVVLRFRRAREALREWNRSKRRKKKLGE